MSSTSKPLQMNGHTQPVNTSPKVDEVKFASTKRQDDDWPLVSGFESTIEAREPVELAVRGRIPPYAAGVLYRTGPGQHKIETDKGETFSLSHWFDGFSHVHRFNILPNEGDTSTCRVIYNSRFTADKRMEQIRKTGSMEDITFGQKRDPCESFFKKAMSSYKAASRSGEPNIGVTLSINMPGLFPPSGSSSDDKPRGHASGIATLTAKTDSAALLRLDPETLEPLGVTNQRGLHPLLSGPLSCAHARSDPHTGDIFNFNLATGHTPVYRVFRVSAATGKTDILATLKAQSAYIHSFFLTDRHVVLCVWNSHLDPSNGLKILWERNMLDAIGKYDASKPAKWYVIDRLHGRGLLATYESEPFFAFHTINSWTEPPAASSSSSSPSSAANPQSGSGDSTSESSIDIVTEVSTYPSLDILHGLYYSNLFATMHASPDEKRADAVRHRLRRFRLPAVPVTSSASTTPRKAQVEYSSPASESPELPTLNPAYVTRPHRFTYGLSDRHGRANSLWDSLVKWDSQTRSGTHWEADACVPGEPIFVSDPEADEDDEDRGTLLSVVLDQKKGHSFLLALDARTMAEVGRAEVGGVVGLGFHGVHVPKEGRRQRVMHL